MWTYLVTTLTEHVRINRQWVRNSMTLPAIPPYGAGTEQVVLLGSPDWDRALGTSAISMPHLEHRLLAGIVGANAALGIII
jgi:hypothetical protein